MLMVIGRIFDSSPLKLGVSEDVAYCANPDRHPRKPQQNGVRRKNTVRPRLEMAVLEQVADSDNNISCCGPLVVRQIGPSLGPTQARRQMKHPQISKIRRQTARVRRHPVAIASTLALLAGAG